MWRLRLTAASPYDVVPDVQCIVVWCVAERNQNKESIQVPRLLAFRTTKQNQPSIHSILVLDRPACPSYYRSVWKSANKMGKVFLEHINGQKLYNCAACETNLTNKRELISTRFTGATGRCRGQRNEGKRRRTLSFANLACFRFPLFSSPGRPRLSVQAGGQPDVLPGAGSHHADRTSYGAGRDVQELQGQARLDVRVCDGGDAKVSDGGENGARNRCRLIANVFFFFSFSFSN